MSSIIVIGGSDPSGGAGIQADLFTLHSLGLSAFSVITAVTAQNEKKFFSYETVSKENFQKQLQTLPVSPSSIVKIGMLGSGILIPPLFSWLKKIKPQWIILDPILKSSTGFPLIDPQGAKWIKEKLIYQVDLITPNISETEFLTGISIRNLQQLKIAGLSLMGSAPSRSRLKAILLKGGHLKNRATDLLIEKNKIHSFGKRRISGKGIHGSGCTLASAIAGFLAQEKDLTSAVQSARQVVLRKLRKAGRF